MWNNMAHHIIIKRFDRKANWSKELFEWSDELSMQLCEIKKRQSIHLRIIDDA